MLVLFQEAVIGADQSEPGNIIVIERKIEFHIIAVGDL